MSEIYLAVREDGIYEGRVAIKLVRAGLEGDAMFARFATAACSFIERCGPNGAEQ